MTCTKNSCTVDNKTAGKKADRPDPGSFVATPDANVSDEGQCVIAPHAESARPGTGEPCEDALNGPEMKARS
ncbi:hypothetical protein LJC23_05670 [Desulfovibrio sp. OttesenSCG-928-I05]|nr:hypothetical protein [Desulfovibrio sp. OttesenSCG-928-I05]